MTGQHDSLMRKFAAKRAEVAVQTKKIRESIVELNQAIRVIGAQISADVDELKLTLEELEELRDQIASKLQDDFSDLDDDHKQSGAGRNLRRWVKTWRDADANPYLSIEKPDPIKVGGIEAVEELIELPLAPP